MGVESSDNASAVVPPVGADTRGGSCAATPELFREQDVPVAVAATPR